MKYLIKNKTWEINKFYNKEKILYLLIDRPDYIHIYNSAIMWLNNKRISHREYDLPAFIWDNGEIFWYTNGRAYRAKYKINYNKEKW